LKSIHVIPYGGDRVKCGLCGENGHRKSNCRNPLIRSTLNQLLSYESFTIAKTRLNIDSNTDVGERNIRFIIANFGIYDGEAGPLERFDPATGQRETLLSEVGGRALTSSNYPIIDNAGNIWCANSTHAPTWPEALDGRPDGFLFVLRPDGSSQIVAEGLCFPNGLAMSADEKFLFCAQTSAGDVLRFPILAGALLGKAERYGPKLGIVARRKLNPDIHLPAIIQSRLGYTDGVGLDAEGNLWVCLPAANKVVAITPAGRKITVIHDPSGTVVNHPTNVTWGGPSLTDLYIGSIRANYVLKAVSPVAGQPLLHQL
jgi:gluconolactonase